MLLVDKTILFAIYTIQIHGKHVLITEKIVIQYHHLLGLFSYLNLYPDCALYE